jgi:hypothetical protein
MLLTLLFAVMVFQSIAFVLLSFHYLPVEGRIPTPAFLAATASRGTVALIRPYLRKWRTATATAALLLGYVHELRKHLQLHMAFEEHLGKAQPYKEVGLTFSHSPASFDASPSIVSGDLVGL